MPRIPYEQKFRQLLRMVETAKRQNVKVVIVHHPEVLGDDYAELVESLNRISAADLMLAIVPPSQRGAPDLPAKR